MKIHPSIPSFKFCPSCGCQEHLAFFEKKISCSACQFCFYFNPATAVTLILENNNAEFLILTRNQDPGKGLLDLPGGFVDPFETAEFAATREIKEELNIHVEKFNYVSTAFNLYTYKNVTYQTVDICYHAHIGDAKIELNEENSSYSWLNKEALKNATYAFSSVSIVINDFLSQQLKRNSHDGI